MWYLCVKYALGLLGILMQGASECSANCEESAHRMCDYFKATNDEQLEDLWILDDFSSDTYRSLLEHSNVGKSLRGAIANTEDVSEEKWQPNIAKANHIVKRNRSEENEPTRTIWLIHRGDSMPVPGSHRVSEFLARVLTIVKPRP